jgi:hypothetical protein
MAITQTIKICVPPANLPMKRSVEAMFANATNTKRLHHRGAILAKNAQILVTFLVMRILVRFTILETGAL